jgi:hypothetical protein
MKFNLPSYSGLALVVFVLSASAVQAQVIQQEKLYSENGVEVTYQILDAGTKSLGVPGNTREYPNYQIRLILQNNTGSRIKFRNHSTVSFMRYSITPFNSVGINGNYIYEPGETVMYSRGTGFVFDDRLHDEIGPPRYSIASWYIYDSSYDERESELTKILDQG